MKIRHKFSLAVFTTAALCVFFFIGFVQPSIQLKNESSEFANLEESGFAIIELFTSQGCSSCPPADRLLNQLLDRAESDKSPIYGLSFHVDYWNYLGWKDPYSHEAWSKRQRAYSQRTGDRRVYTPQMIVNGKDGFVGSNAVAAEAAIRKAIQASPKVQIQLSSTLNRLNHSLSVTYKLEGDFQNHLLNVALVEDEIENYVKRGENATKTLKHSHVVRAMNTIQVDQAEGSSTIEFPEDVKLQNSQIIAYVQQAENFHVVGATRSDIPSL